MEHDEKCERMKILKSLNVQLSRRREALLSSVEAQMVYTQPAAASRSCYCKERADEGCKFPPTDRDTLVEGTLRWILSQRMGLEGPVSTSLHRQREEFRHGGSEQGSGQVIEVDFTERRRIR